MSKLKAWALPPGNRYVEDLRDLLWELGIQFVVHVSVDKSGDYQSRGYSLRRMTPPSEKWVSRKEAWSAGDDVPEEVWQQRMASVLWTALIATRTDAWE